MNRPRVAVACFSHHSGGMEMDALRLAKRLQRAADVLLLCRAGTPLESWSRESGTIQFNAFAFRGNWSWRFARELRKWLRENNVSNLIFFGASELHSIRLAVNPLNINLIVRHGTTKNRPKKDILHRWTYSRVRHYVGISQHLTRNIEAILPIAPGAQVHCIYSALDEFPDANHTPSRTTGEPLRLLHVGRFAPEKGQRDALMACASLHEIGIEFRLSFAGDGKELDELRREAESLPYANSVTFLGQVSPIANALSKAEIFLFPSHGEGMPNALIEALGAGLTCITYDNTVFPEFADLGFQIHLAPDRDTAALGRALLDVAQNIDREREAAAQNTPLARSLFSVEREVAEYLALLVPPSDA